MLLISWLALYAPILQADHTDACELAAHNVCIDSCKADVVADPDLAEEYDECRTSTPFPSPELDEQCAAEKFGAGFAACQDSQNTDVNSCTVAGISTSCTVADATAIPTLSEWGMILLIMVLGFVGYRKSLKYRALNVVREKIISGYTDQENIIRKLSDNKPRKLNKLYDCMLQLSYKFLVIHHYTAI